MNLQRRALARACLAATLGVSLLQPAPVSAATFRVAIVATATNLHLQATTVPPGQLVWYSGGSVEAITNVVATEAAPVVQHDFELTPGAGARAAFFRAANLVTNLPPVPLAVGASHSLAVLTNGMLACWGTNDLGQLGNGLPTITYDATNIACWFYPGVENPTVGPLVPTSDTNWVSVAAGDNHSLALKADGTMWSWGDDSYGQLGVPLTLITNLLPASPNQIGLGQHWQAVFAEANSSFAIRDDGTLWAWGENTNSILGVGLDYAATNTVWSPVQVGSASNWVKVIGTRDSFGAGLQSDGSLWAWGLTDLPSYVRAGYANSNYLTSPVTTSPALAGMPGPWTDLAVSFSSAWPGIVALRADGTLWAHPYEGANDPADWAQFLGFLDNQYTNPASLYNILLGAGATPAQALSITENAYAPEFTFGLTNLNFPALLAVNSDSNYFKPYSARNGWMMVDYAIALNQDGTVWTIGESFPRLPSAPQDGDWQQVNADTDWRYVATGPGGVNGGVNGFAAAKAGGQVWTWGEGGGILANGSVSRVSDMVQVAPTNQWISAKQSNTHVVALDVESNLWVWGGNQSGELGVGDNQPRLAPTLLPLAGPWTDYAVGGSDDGSFTLAIRQDGELWAWGNYNGTGTNLPTPVRLNPARPWGAVYAAANEGYIQSYALAQDGTLWGLGDNGSGALGVGSTNPPSTTVLIQLPGSNWCSVSLFDPGAFGFHAFGLQTNGSRWAWGYNQGDLALPGPATNILTAPVQALGSNWVAAAAGYGVGFGIQTDGTLWAWGGGPPEVSTNALEYPTSLTFESTLGIAALNTLINWVYWDCLGNPGPYPPTVFLATTNYVPEPIPIDAETDWTAVHCVGVPSTTFALKQDGSLWLWGSSPFASVTNTFVFLTPPTHPYPNVPYPADSAWIAVPQRVGTNTWSFVDPADTAAVTTSGELYLWGNNADGQLLVPPVWLPQPVVSNVVCRLPPTTP